MSDEGTVWDAPNQQVVRRDASAPWDEGDGGAPGDQPPGGGEIPVEETASYDAMTKAELIELAQEQGISPANNDMTKAELIEALEA